MTDTCYVFGEIEVYYTPEDYGHVASIQGDVEQARCILEQREVDYQDLEDQILIDLSGKELHEAIALFESWFNKCEAR